jgi:hypothetical protein
MIRVQLETEEMHLHTIGVQRARHLTCVIILACAFGLVFRGGQLATGMASHQVKQQRRHAEEALARVVLEVERVRLRERQLAGYQRWQEQVDGARTTVTEALKGVASATPSELSLSEMWIERGGLRLRGVAAHGGAIQEFLNRLAQLLPVKEAALKNVQRIEEQGAWHDQFLIQIHIADERETDGMNGAGMTTSSRPAHANREIG